MAKTVNLTGSVLEKEGTSTLTTIPLALTYAIDESNNQSFILPPSAVDYEVPMAGITIAGFVCIKSDIEIEIKLESNLNIAHKIKDMFISAGTINKIYLTNPSSSVSAHIQVYMSDKQ